MFAIIWFNQTLAAQCEWFCQSSFLKKGYKILVHLYMSPIVYMSGYVYDSQTYRFPKGEQGIAYIELYDNVPNEIIGLWINIDLPEYHVNRFSNNYIFSFLRKYKAA